MAANSKIEWTDATWNPERALLQPLKWKKPRRIFVNSMSDLFREDLPDETIDRAFAVMALCPHTFQVLTKRAERMREYFAPIGCVNCGDGQLDGRCCDEPYILHGDAAAQGFRDALIEGQAQALYSQLHPDESPESISMTMAVHMPLPNVWLGVSTERQQEADERIPHLLATPAAVRFVSCEPLLGPVDLRNVHGGTLDALDGIDFEATGDIRDAGDLSKTQRPPSLDWVIVGGESGKNARPFHLEWADSIVAQCKSASVACFVKQLGSAPMSSGYAHPLKSKKGGDWEEWPDRLRVRDMPRDGVEHNGMPNTGA